MTPLQYLRSLRRHWWMVVVLVILATVGAYVMSATRAPVYQASSSQYYTLNFGQSGNDLAQGSNYAQSQMQSFAALAVTQVVLDPVIDKLDLPDTTDELASKVDVTTPRATVVLQITVSDTSPVRAAATANAIAEQLRTVVMDYAPKQANREPAVRVDIIQRAVVPKVPTSPQTRRNTLLGFVGGAVFGLVLVGLIGFLDRRLRTSDEVREAHPVPYLGSLGLLPDAPTGVATVLQSPSTRAAEEYRQFRANLQFVAVGQDPLLALVTSTASGDGKSTVALNLAMIIAESGKSVLLIDADLRRPRLAEYANVAAEPGLTNILVGETTLEDVVQEVGPLGLDVLPAGSTAPNPGELLASVPMQDVLVDASLRYDVVLLDTAPILAVADAGVLGHQVDGVVLVVSAGRTTTRDLSEAMRALGASGAKVLGTVLNRASRRDSRTDDYYDTQVAEQ